ncbi:MAG: molybdopterin-dependent oxidoreductase [Treponema sp.]|nr:molybdopterin-dependent oxidoreductase [Treponema sp.]
MPRTKKKALKIQKFALESKDFYSDMQKENLLYAALIRSPTTIGKIKNITIENLPKDYFLFTAKDIPGSKTIKINNNEVRIFGYDDVAYKGEAIGIIAGPNERRVLELLEKVQVTFDIENLETALKKVIKNRKHPIVIDKSQAINEVEESQTDFTDFVSQINKLPSLDTVIDRNKSDDSILKNIYSREVKNGIYKELPSDERNELLKSYQVCENTWKLTLKNPNWKETCGAFCSMENGTLHVYTATRWTSLMHKSIQKALELPAENIIIHKTKDSGVYSKGLWRSSQLAAQVAVASFLSKHPVKLALTQQEQELYMAPGLDTEITHKTFFTKDGKIKALESYIKIDAGAFNPFANEITDRIVISAAGFYKPENIHILAECFTSKNPPTSINIKNVDNQALYAIENQIQLICEKSKVFPEEARILNSECESKDYPFEIPTAGLKETIENTLKISDFNRKYASFHMDAIDRVEKNTRPFFALPLRGVGIASGYNVSGYYGTNFFTYKPKIEVTLMQDEKVVIHAVKPSEVIQEIWKTTAAEILQIEKNNIEINSEFELSEIPQEPEDTLTSIGIINEIIRKCCIDIQKKRFHQPLPISSKKGLSTVLKKNWNETNFSGKPFHGTSIATTAVEIELDPYTYSEKIKGIWITVDCGELFDEKAALRTIRLELQQTLANLVEEKSISYDNCVIKFLHSKNKNGQIGELIHNTLPAAFSSALSMALATELTKLPCTEMKIFKLIREREEKNINEEKVENKEVEVIPENLDKNSEIEEDNRPFHRNLKEGAEEQ